MAEKGSGSCVLLCGESLCFGFGLIELVCTIMGEREHIASVGKGAV